MSTLYRVHPVEFQKSEATTARRQLVVQVGTVEAQTVTVSQAGGAFTQSTSTATQLADSLFTVTLAAADLSTDGALALKLTGATDWTYVSGMRVVRQDPFSDLHEARQAAVGMVVYDASDNSITVYETDEITSIAKRILTTAGTQQTWTPTTV